jgi:hypothetical protein
MRHNSYEYVIYAIRENAKSIEILRAIMPFVKFFNENSSKPLSVEVMSIFSSKNKEQIQDLELQYNHDLDPIFLVEPDKNVVNYDSIVEFVKNIAVQSKYKAVNMNENSPLGRLQQKPAERPMEIDSLSDSNNSRGGTNLIGSAANTKSKKTTNFNKRSSEIVKPKEDNWKPNNISPHYDNAPTSTDQKLMNQYSESTYTNSNINDDIQSYFKNPGPLLNQGIKY